MAASRETKCSIPSSDAGSLKQPTSRVWSQYIPLQLFEKYANGQQTGSSGGVFLKIVGLF